MFCTFFEVARYCCKPPSKHFKYRQESRTLCAAFCAWCTFLESYRASIRRKDLKSGMYQVFLIRLNMVFYGSPFIWTSNFFYFTSSHRLPKGQILSNILWNIRQLNKYRSEYKAVKKRPNSSPEIRKLYPPTPPKRIEAPMTTNLHSSLTCLSWVQNNAWSKFNLSCSSGVYFSNFGSVLKPFFLRWDMKRASFDCFVLTPKHAYLTLRLYAMTSEYRVGTTADLMRFFFTPRRYSVLTLNEKEKLPKLAHNNVLFRYAVPSISRTPSLPVS